MRLVCFSDWHGRLLPKEKFPDGDILVLAGDFELVNKSDIKRLFDSLPVEKYNRVLFTPGNHDLAFRNPDATNFYKSDKIVILSNYKIIEINNVTFQGFSWCYGDINLSRTWAFTTYDFLELKNKVEKLAKCDVLVSHCPPYCMLDQTYIDNHIGLACLTDKIFDKYFKTIICGHVHEYGGQSDKIGDVNIYNVATNSGKHGYDNPKRMFTIVEV